MYVIVIDEKKCTVCGECISICPVEIYQKQDERIAIGNADECSGCQSCVSMCEAQALTVSEV
jgi:NAD-dependent dihydropyrimidine dehydrogenase PreA subunit